MDGSEAERYIPLVRRVANSIMRFLPAGAVEIDELVSEGTIGLVAALEKFDESKGVRFTTYASRRIRGAILDGLRRADWVARSTRARARSFEAARKKLQGELGREPTGAEHADGLDMCLEDYNSALLDFEGGALLYLESVANPYEDKPLRLVDQLAAGPYPDEEVQVAEERRLVAEILLELPETYRHTISMYYYDGLTMREIGAVFSVSESMVCNYLREARRLLRRAYHARE